MVLAYLREKVLLFPPSGPPRKLSLLPEIQGEYKPDSQMIGGAYREGAVFCRRELWNNGIME
jgi:hypothetical protein